MAQRVISNLLKDELVLNKKLSHLNHYLMKKKLKVPKHLKSSPVVRKMFNQK